MSLRTLKNAVHENDLGTSIENGRLCHGLLQPVVIIPLKQMT